MAGLISAGLAAVLGDGLAIGTALTAGLMFLMIREFTRSRTVESLAYPLAGGVLGSSSRPVSPRGYSTATPPRKVGQCGCRKGHPLADAARGASRGFWRFSCPFKRPCRSALFGVTAHSAMKHYIYGLGVSS